jgi:hypothetical protein
MRHNAGLVIQPAFRTTLNDLVDFALAKCLPFSQRSLGYALTGAIAGHLRGTCCDTLFSHLSLAFHLQALFFLYTALSAL